MTEGGMWEGRWEVLVNEECSELGGGSPCPHCHSIKTKVNERYDKKTWNERVWTCPFVVVAYNEGGYATTGVCLDCIKLWRPTSE